MKILSHRGYWKSVEEKNTVTAFERSFSLGFGTETDVRDCAGTLVISHDMPTGNEQTFASFLDSVPDGRLTLALNVKADGMAATIHRMMKDYPDQDWFVFDMSIPDMKAYLDLGMPVFARISEVEREIPWVERVKGIWLDAFHGDWFDADCVEQFLVQGKEVCIVSPDLHRRDHLPMWAMLRRVAHHDRLTLCTDFPEDAQRFFGEAS
ncbi:phosphodiesterase [Silvimonas amylolytica]|uniref:Phosphodiesterase n=1 Tax=Silvimonas amylolytica TaxID=449663 RepID=A0ABQ2PJE2_9NEIS|nr:phosphodiesterase [Silvimonas amylolytica]GGP25441.1 hypothetical protein GCM10010971_12600 [Silvimonas amylolytica]